MLVRSLLLFGNNLHNFRLLLRSDPVDAMVGASSTLANEATTGSRPATCPHR